MFTSETAVPAPTRSAAEGLARERRTGAGAGRAGTRGAVSLLDPLHVARAVWAARPMILLAGLLGLGLAFAYAAATPKTYQATVQILMDPRDLKVVANEVTPNGLPSEATLALIESQTSVILSNNVLSRVVAKAGLESDAEFNGSLRTGLSALLPSVFSPFSARPDAGLRDRELRTLARLRHALGVGRETKSFVINLTVSSIDPAKAARLANLTAEVFIAEQGRVQSDTARRATDSLSARLSELRRSVVEAEGEVEAYKSLNALIGVGGRLVDDDYIVRINDQLAKARGDITALRVKAESMRTASVEDVVRGTLPEELSSTALVRLRQSYSDLAQQAAVLATKLGPRHPQRLASEGALAAARAAIAGELSRIVAAAQTELARAEETEKDLTAQIGELKTKQVETSGAFVKLRELEREVDASRAVYEAFLLRARETSEQESLNTANVRVISDATAPLEPSGLSRKVVVLAGLVLGLLAGVAAAAGRAVIGTARTLFADRPAADPAAAPNLRHAAASPLPLPGLRPAVYDAGDALRRYAPGGGLPPSGADRPPAAGPERESAAPLAERQALRERVRALSAGKDLAPLRRTDASAELDAAGLRDDLVSVRETIAAIRRRRTVAVRS